MNRLRLIFYTLSLIIFASCGDGFGEDDINPDTSTDDGSPKYSDYLGYWTLEGTMTNGLNSTYSYSVLVEKKVNNLSYNVYGFSSSNLSFDYPLEMIYNEDGSVSITSGQDLGDLERDDIKYNIRIICKDINENYTKNLNYKGGFYGTIINDEIQFKSKISTEGLAYAATCDGYVFFINNDGYMLLKPTMKKLAATSAVYSDGEIIPIQKHTIGNGINIVILGDGYSPNYDFNENGKFINDVHNATEALFDTEPYYSLRGYFDVYAIASYSDERGASNSFTNKKRNTIFSSGFVQASTSTSMYTNNTKITSYTSKFGFKKENTFVTMLVNEDVQGGTSTIYFTGTYPNVGIVPTCNKNGTFQNIVRHEVCGHTIALLADEYIYQNAQLPESKREATQKNMQYGFGSNISFETQEEVPWSKYFSISRYTNVGYYEGALEYQFGVWRCEDNSCMNDNRKYFAASSREAIYRTIKQIAGEEFSFNDFLEYDKINLNTDGRSAATHEIDEVEYPFKTLPEKKCTNCVEFYE